jgi:hypothetical protein
MEVNFPRKYALKLAVQACPVCVVLQFSEVMAKAYPLKVQQLLYVSKAIPVPRIRTCRPIFIYLFFCFWYSFLLDDKINNTNLNKITASRN